VPREQGAECVRVAIDMTLQQLGVADLGID
jgi:hypothetical protein